MLIIYAYFLIYTFGTSIKNLSLVYFCNYVLGTYNDSVTQTMISVIGGLPCAYVFMALFADVLDHLEWKTGFRSDGVAMSVYNIIAVAMVGICTGVILAALLVFLNVEKGIVKKQAEIKAREEK